MYSILYARRYTGHLIYIIFNPIAQAAATWRAIAQARGATPRPRSGAEAGRTPCPKGGSQEELPHVQGWAAARVPHCDGARTAERSYPVSEVREGRRREDTQHLRSGAVAGRSYPTPPRRRPGAAAGRSNPRLRPGNGKPLQYSCLENPMNSMKRQNDRILKEKLPRSVGAQ